MAETDVQGIRIALVTIFLIAIAMASGYRRGTLREAATTVLLAFFASLPSTPLGVSLVDSLNSIARQVKACLLYTSPSPRDRTRYRMPSSA